MTLDDKFMDKKVFVESQMYGGQDDDQTQMYKGTYKGTESIGNREVIVLENAFFYKLNDLPNEDGETHTPLMAIPWNYVMSVSLDEKKEDDE